MEPLFFGIITEPWQVYVAAAVFLVAAGTGIWRGVIRANRAEERKARQAQEAQNVQDEHKVRAH